MWPYLVFVNVKYFNEVQKSIYPDEFNSICLYITLELIIFSNKFLKNSLTNENKIGMLLKGMIEVLYEWILNIGEDL